MANAQIDRTVERLTTAAECDGYVINVAEKHPELAKQARRRGIEFRAVEHGAANDAERACFEALHAYEEVLFQKHGKRVKATYVRRKIKKDGIIKAIEHAVLNQHDPVGFTTLKEMGFEDLSFESVVLKHADAFSAEAVAQAQKRLDA